VLSSPHGQRFAGWERPQPSLSEVRAQYGGPSISDEELLLRYMVPLEDLEAVRAAGPVNPTYRFHDTTSLPELVEHAFSLKRPRHLVINRPDVQFTLRRSE
jgi:oxaloacetate decarboxylase alpha subunit